MILFGPNQCTIIVVELLFKCYRIYYAYFGTYTDK